MAVSCEPELFPVEVVLWLYGTAKSFWSAGKAPPANRVFEEKNGHLEKTESDRLVFWLLCFLQS